MHSPRPFAEPVYTARPVMPDKERYVAHLEGIWTRQWLTNAGPLHEELTLALRDHLRIDHLSLVANATIGLMLALRALDLEGEVITTPFTFPATPNVVANCGLTPVFADIDDVSMTLSPAAVEAAITPRTSAILGVHVYGMPCDVHALQRIADRHGLRVVYDAAHAFGTELDGTPITAFGDASAYSFHATKLFHTAEGGAVVSRSAELRERVDLLRNFGIRNETTVELPGINGKMNELQAALGLCNLELIEAERSARAEIADVYTDRLDPRLGIRCVRPPSSVRDSRQYFAVRIAGGAGRRDAVYEGLKRYNVFSRRYFYPLCSDYEFYKQLPSARADLLPTARRAAAEVLCLPYFGGLGADGAHRICDMIEHIVAEGNVSTP